MKETPRKRNSRPLIYSTPFMLRSPKKTKEDIEKAAHEDGFKSISNLTRLLWRYYLNNRELLINALANKKKK